jgi:oxalate decarboxylase/phosphoglucose isomerase-like protein (cupin superfamily)
MHKVSEGSSLCIFGGWSLRLRRPKRHAKVGAFAYFSNHEITPRTMYKLGTGVITSNQDVDRLEFDWGKIHFLSEPAVTGAVRFSFGIVELAAGKGHERHNHPGSEEIIYVVSGQGEQMVDDRPPVKVGPGSSIYIPADVYHSTLNTGRETMMLAVVYSPAGPERLLREIPGCKIFSS